MASKKPAPKKKPAPAAKKKVPAAKKKAPQKKTPAKARAASSALSPMSGLGSGSFDPEAAASAMVARMMANMGMGDLMRPDRLDRTLSALLLHRLAQHFAEMEGAPESEGPGEEAPVEMRVLFGAYAAFLRWVMSLSGTDAEQDIRRDLEAQLLEREPEARLAALHAGFEAVAYVFPPTAAQCAAVVHRMVRHYAEVSDEDGPGEYGQSFIAVPATHFDTWFRELASSKAFTPAVKKMLKDVRAG
ncbi:MAG: hypothetical protein RL653_1865 [Pseudomonadota bacterium]|jgi:hypothetical protein